MHTQPAYDVTLPPTHPVQLTDGVLEWTASCDGVLLETDSYELRWRFQHGDSVFHAYAQPGSINVDSSFLKRLLTQPRSDTRDRSSVDVLRFDDPFCILAQGVVSGCMACGYAPGDRYVLRIDDLPSGSFVIEVSRSLFDEHRDRVASLIDSIQTELGG